MPEADHTKIVVLEGDETGQELLEEALQCVTTPDVGSQSSTTEFIDDVIRRVKTKLEVWASMV
jgi:isocitrate/isopropylmalate dehydrogenase